MKEIKNLMDQLMGTSGVLGCGIVTKDGRPVEMRLPESMNQETIAIMAATVYGGSTTLHTEAGRPHPTSIDTAANGYRTAIYQCGRRSLAFVMMDEGADKAKVKELVDMLGNEFGPI